MLKLIAYKCESVIGRFGVEFLMQRRIMWPANCDLSTFKAIQFTRSEIRLAGLIYGSARLKGTGAGGELRKNDILKLNIYNANRYR